MFKTRTTQVKRCLTTLLAVLMLVSLVSVGNVSASATTDVTAYTENFSTLTNAQIVSGSTITMPNGATLKFSNNDSEGNHTLTIENGALKSTSTENKKGWAVTYTLPETLYGKVIVDCDWRMGDFDSTGAVVSMQHNGNCYHGNRIIINDESSNKMTSWGFNKSGLAYINNRDNGLACATCGVAMEKFKESSTATVNHESMTTLRAILDTEADTVEGGYVEDGIYRHNQSQFDHNAGHNVVLPQATADCGGVKSITFLLYPDVTLSEYGSCMWLDNIYVSNANEVVEYPTRFYKESFSDLTNSDIVSGRTYTASNGATLAFANNDTSGDATLTAIEGVLKATATSGKGWSVTYTLPKTVYGKVNVDIDFRMGSIVNGEEVALSGGNSHYSSKIFCVNDEKGSSMSNWGLNKTNLTYLNGRDTQSICVNCDTAMGKFSGSPTAYFSHDSMTTLRAILDTDADTVEGGAVIDGEYTHLKSQFGHSGDHNVVFGQLTENCGGVKSITFNLFAQDGSSPGTTFIEIDNITVTNVTSDDTFGAFVTDCKVTNGYDTEITSIGANEHICVDAKYVNGGNSAMNDAFLCIALYDADDRLLTVGASEENIAVGEIKSMSLDFKTPDDLASGAYVKVFVWKSSNALNPIQNEIIIGK